MDRPQSIFGLVTHLARLRWQALSPRGRMLAVVATAGLLGASAAGMHAMSCGSACCASSGDCASSEGCPMAAQAHAQAELADGAEGEVPPCHRGR